MRCYYAFRSRILLCCCLYHPVVLLFSSLLLLNNINFIILLPPVVESFHHMPSLVYLLNGRLLLFRRKQKNNPTNQLLLCSDNESSFNYYNNNILIRRNPIVSSSIVRYSNNPNQQPESSNVRQRRNLTSRNPNDINDNNNFDNNNNNNNEIVRERKSNNTNRKYNKHISKDSSSLLQHKTPQLTIKSQQPTRNGNSSPNIVSKQKPTVIGKKIRLDRLPKPDLITQLQYTRNGHAVLRKLLTRTNTNTNNSINLISLRTILYEYGQSQQLRAWQQKVEVATEFMTITQQQQYKRTTIEECRTSLMKLGIPPDTIPFLQYFNCWKQIPTVYNLCTILAETAAILLDVESVRLYQDSLFWKRRSPNNNNNNNKSGGDGPTPWHTDAKMGPFDTNHFITFWIPLQNIPAGGSGLIFCSKTHNDFALPYWNPNSNDINNHLSQWNRLDERYKNRGYIDYYYYATTTSKKKQQQQKEPQLVDYMPLDVGDVTVHAGWTLHCADPCSPMEIQDRLALAISFVDARAPVRKDAQQSVRLLLKKQQQQQQEGSSSRNNNKDNKIPEYDPTINNYAQADREDIWSYQDWVTEVPTNSFEWDHPLVPILWPPPPPQSSPPVSSKQKSKNTT